MGTMIQGYRLDEAGYRGACLADHAHDLKGDNDVLVLTQPDVDPRDPRRVSRGRRRHHRDEHVQRDVDRAGRLRARASRARDQLRGGATRARVRRRLDRDARPTSRASSPARSGPTNRTASISPDVNDPGARNVRFDELVATVRRGDRGPRRRRRRSLPRRDDLRHAERQGRAVRARIVFRPRRAAAFRSSCPARSPTRPAARCPGQTTEAFWNSVRHVRPLAVGINCSLGARADAPVHRGDGARRRHVRLVLSERRAAESDGRDGLRRDAGADRAPARATSRGAASSTSSAAAAARRPRTSARSPSGGRRAAAQACRRKRLRPQPSVPGVLRTGPDRSARESPCPA